MKKNIPQILLVVQLWLLFALLLCGSRQLSFTYDEPAHLAAGYTYLSQGTKSMWLIPLRGHPLLINAWEALPLYIGYPNLPVEKLSGWGQDRRVYARAFTQAMETLNKGGMENIEVSGRIPAALLTLLLAAIICRWAKDLWGKVAAPLALLILTFDPTLLAHGRLATNDVGVTALGTLSLYLTWRWSNKPDYEYVLLAGVSLGLTLLSKGSGVLWAAAGCGAMLWQILWPPARSRHSTNHQNASYLPGKFILLMHVTMTGMIALCIVWTMYGFEIGTLPALPAIPVPAPTHWQSIFFQVVETGNRTAFALGRTTQGNWWWYFPIAFLLKNPLPFLIGILLSCYIWLRYPSLRRRLYSLSIFTGLYTTVAIVQGPNIGYRHLFPLHPSLYLLLTGALFKFFPTAAKFRPNRYFFSLASLGVLFGWYIGGTLHAYPDEIAFFNEGIGGLDNGWRYLDNSNTDWRQGWKALKTWQEEHDILFYYPDKTGYTDLDDYGIQSIPLPEVPLTPERLRYPQLYFYPLPGKHIISVNRLRKNQSAWFRYRQPQAIIAHTLFFYDVKPLNNPWLAQCSIPTPPLNEEAIQVGFDTLSPRILAFDCKQTWVYPNGGQQTGWYALHDQLLRPEGLSTDLFLQFSQPTDPFIFRHLEPTTQSFRQREYHHVPAFALFQWDSPPPLSTTSTLYLPENVVPDSAACYPAPAETAPTSLSEDTQLPPFQIGEKLAFLGIKRYIEQDSLEIETWWQAGEDFPLERPLSIMAHLITSQGEIRKVSDGFGISPLSLKKGDIIVQRHQFPTFEEQDWLRIGIYWLDDGKRWNVNNIKEADAIFIPVLLE